MIKTINGRRRRTHAVDGVECVMERWTESCSGCTELCDGQNIYGHPYDDKAKCIVGAGCSECGYTGKRRRSMYVPVPKEGDEC